jgi:hypothetical protein
MKTQIDPTDDVPDAIPFPLPLDTEQELKGYFGIFTDLDQQVPSPKSSNSPADNDSGSLVAEKL